MPAVPERRILVVSHDVVGETMAGAGIRAYQLARALTQAGDVVLAVPCESPAPAHPELSVIPYTRGDWSSIEPEVRFADVVVFPSDIASDFPQLGQSQACLVVDGYDPLLAEWLSLSASLEVEAQQEHWWRRMRDLSQQFMLGDFFICASERQRDWWLGLLEASGRINAWTFREDPSLRRLIDTVPFGLPERAPEHTRQVLKGVWPGIGDDDRVILWGGGLWPWLDPLTAIRALARIWERRRDVRLVFPGTAHPNPQMAEMPTHTAAARQLAEELGLADRAVFFGSWIPYQDWPNVLLESDLAVSLHFDTLETRLAFRSRLLDSIWVGVPIVATKGDATSDLVTSFGIGSVVECGDVDGVAEAILKLLETPRERYQERFERARQRLAWTRVARPLIEFCRQPRRAPDRVALAGTYRGLFHQLEEIERLSREKRDLEALVRGYEQGRFIRFMRFIAQEKQRLQKRLASPLRARTSRKAAKE